MHTTSDSNGNGNGDVTGDTSDTRHRVVVIRNKRSVIMKVILTVVRTMTITSYGDTSGEKHSSE